MKNKNFNKKNAFSLLEMIVAVAIFSIVSTICIGIYILTMKANVKVTSMQKIQNEMRFAMDYISREIRLGNVDYSYYPDSTIINSTNVLALEGNSSNRILFRKKDNENNNGILQVKYDNLEWSDITTNNVNLEDLYFYISPTGTSDNPQDLNKQGLVTVFMKFFDEKSNSNVVLQTTISTRNYIK